MKYGGCLFSVKDINLARKFYEELFGMEVVTDYGRNIVFAGGLSLQQDFDWLVGISQKDMKVRENNCEIYFETEQFEEFITKLKAKDNIILLHSVNEAPWGQRIIRLYDPDNHLIEVGETLKSVVERFQKQGMTIEIIAERMDVTIEEVYRILKA